LISPESLLVANEIIKSRAQILSYNLSKWGTANTVVTNNEPDRFSRLNGYFDLVIVDAPCSGSGLFRKQPEAIDEWSPAHVTSCSVRQQRILDDIQPCLKAGGILIYSTCSFSVEENENIIKSLVNTGEFEQVKLQMDHSWGVVESGYGYRFYPHLTRSEGFFLAVLRRTGEGENGHHKSKNKVVELNNSEREIARNFLPKINGSLFRINAQIHFANSAVKEFLMLAQDQFYFRKAGVVVGEVKGRDLVPNHELSLVVDRSERLPTKELSDDDALRFLRKEVIEAGEKVNGFCLMTHQNLGLGWAKILDKRMNNYLPNEWRILK
jgi:NOL1/NOP2/fmu family ribosome biogenesis protein